MCVIHYMYMIRTQVYLPKDLYQQVDIVSRKENKAKAAIIRELLAVGLRKKKSQIKVKEAFLELAKIAGEGPKDLSSHLDDYLYGNKK